MNFSSICLLCLEKQDNLLEIFGKLGIDLDIGAILQEHFWFDVNLDFFGCMVQKKIKIFVFYQVSASDESHICGKCWEKVQSFHGFYNFVKLKHQQQPTRDSKSINTNEDNEVLVVFKNEPNIDIKNDLDDSDIAETVDWNTAGCDELEVEVDGNTEIVAVIESSRNYNRKRSTSPSTGTTSKNLKTDSHTSLLSKYFNMNCDLCDIQLLSYRETHKHYKDVHQLDKGYLICCSKKFFRLQHMLQHCQWHIDPESFKQFLSIILDFCRANRISFLGVLIAQRVLATNTDSVII